METEHQIYLNYQEALRSAGKIEEIAEVLQNCGENTFSGICEDIRANWHGENAQLYLSGSDIIVKRNREIVRKMNNIAGVIRKTAENVYRADMEALRISNERIYGK